MKLQFISVSVGLLIGAAAILQGGVVAYEIAGIASVAVLVAGVAGPS